SRREGKAASWVTNPYIRYYWQGGVELVAMMLDYFAFTGDRVFLSDTLLPMADGVLEFYDRHYGRDSAGKLHFEPAQSLETWWVSTNPLPEVAGLRFVLEQLLAIPDSGISGQQRAGWRKLRSELPPLPMRDGMGGRILSPAEKFENNRKNSENPELYAIFPYRIFGAGKPELEMARLSFAGRQTKHAHCWHQDDAQAAYLGLAQQARNLVAQRFARRDAGSRFPGFWGPNNDYTPDFDHGGVGQIALHAMLLQYDGDKIILLPSWPREWDVEFKLRAPKNTTIEGTLRNGKLEQLRVTPAARGKDVVQMEPQ
ncbi:MAG: hypothetical protein NTY38_23945, partial [Acidobacteria bacterium]|nr:hypothetical protein [Acidobacteriota bacterium]